MDGVVLARLRAASDNNYIDVESPLYKQAELVEAMNKKLTEPPKPIKLQRLPSDLQYGFANEFIAIYNNIKENKSVEVGVLSMKGNERFCDPEVYYLLRALALSSSHCIKERSDACMTIFKEIMTTPAATITVKAVYDRLQALNTKEYYVKQLLQAINVCVYGEARIALFYSNLCDYKGFYETAYKLGFKLIKEKEFNEKTLKEFLSENYKQAKEDKEFMKSLYKPGTNKWLTAVIWYFKDTNPEVLQYSQDKGGFA